MYKGLQQVYQQKIGSKAHDLINKIECNPSWPVCFMDTSHGVVLHDFFVFQAAYAIIPDYFYGHDQTGR